MQTQFIRELVALLGPKAVLSQAEDLMLYEYDGSVELGSPECVVFPSTTREVAEIVGLANHYET
ncbi:MAG: FAD-binding protein, partial [Candidatus Acidoferrum typicum]|nr:FAD-binding protein [Candidatus Acidoferrum typicum]